MHIDWQRVLPVIVSIIIIIVVAIIRNISPRFATIAATMPINIPLALWIVSASPSSDAKFMEEFSKGLILGIIPTIGFLIVVWLLFRAGWHIVPTVASGYAAWGVMLLAGWLIQRAFSS